MVKRLRVRDRWTRRNLVFERLKEHFQKRIVLNFKPGLPGTLEHTCINFKNMHYLLGSYNFALAATIRIALECPDNRGKKEEEAVVTISDLRQRMLLLLSDVADQHLASGQMNQMLGLPDIWMNGRGVITEASYPTTDASPTLLVKHRHGSLTKEQFKLRSYRMADKGTEFFPGMHASPSETHTHQLSTM